MNESWPVHTVVFDLDDTLYPEREFVFSGFQAVEEWLQEKHRVPGFADVARKIFAAGRRGKIFDEALPLLGMQPTPERVAELLEVYRMHQPRIGFFPDAAEILEWAGRHFQLALITDGYAAVQARKIRALGLEKYISRRVITDELGREFWKPSLEPYRRVMAQSPGPADGYVYIGDNPRKDFIGARQLGWRTVRVRRAEGEHADYQPIATEAAEAEIVNLLSLRQLLSPKAKAPSR